MKKLKDIFDLDLTTIGGVKQYKKIIDREIISKKDKKEIYNNLKNNKSSSSSNIKYFKTFVSTAEGADAYFLAILYVYAPCVIKYRKKEDNSVWYETYAAINMRELTIENYEILAICCNCSIKFNALGVKEPLINLDDMFKIENFSHLIEEITEEEFYKLN